MKNVDPKELAARIVARFDDEYPDWAIAERVSVQSLKDLATAVANVFAQQIAENAPTTTAMASSVGIAVVVCEVAGREVEG